MICQGCGFNETGGTAYCPYCGTKFSVKEVRDSTSKETGGVPNAAVTITTSSEGVGRHRKQVKGRGEFGHVRIRVDPNVGKGYEFFTADIDNSVPKQFIPAIEKGVMEVLDKGAMDGNPVTDIKVTLIDGSYHAIDSNDQAFTAAASIAVKNALKEAKLVLLEL